MLFSPLYASARLAPLAGGVRLGYLDYKMSDAVSKGEDADSFSQQYSLVATQNGNLYNRRGGPYKLKLTYDHLRYMTNINGEEHSPSSSFFGWDGDLGLKMPHLYGLDLSLYSSKKRIVVPIEDFELGFLTDGFFTDLSFKDTKQSGFKLRLGVNGGPYYYLYQNSYDRVDDKGFHGRFSRLGMSVNSGVNWVHLYRDKESPGGIEKQTFILGNIGLPTDALSTRGSAAYLSIYSDSRLWYRLTNWLDISADFRYSDEENDDEDIYTERATLALEGATRRSSIGAYVFHETVLDGSQKKNILGLPFWADYSLFPRTNLYFSNNYIDSEVKDLATLDVKQSRLLTDSLVLSSSPGRDLFLETGYALKKLDKFDEDMESHSIYFDVYTQRKDRTNYTFSYRYDTDTISTAAYDERTSYSHSLDGYVDYRPSMESKFYLSQAYLSAYQRSSISSERYEIYITTLGLDHVTSLRTRSNLSITRANKLNNDGTEELDNFISAYMKKDINGRLQLKIVLNYNRSQDDLSGFNKKSKSLMSRTNIVYKAAKSLESQTSLETSQVDTSGVDSQSEFKVGEELKYSYNLRGFSKRKLFDLAGAVRYRRWNIGSDRYDDNWLEMKINYYPTLAFSCGAAYDSQSESEIVVKRLYAALKFPLLTLKGGYAQRLNEVVDRKEDIYNIDFTKRF